MRGFELLGTIHLRDLQLTKFYGHIMLCFGFVMTTVFIPLKIAQLRSKNKGTLGNVHKGHPILG